MNERRHEANRPGPEKHQSTSGRYNLAYEAIPDSQDVILPTRPVKSRYMAYETPSAERLHYRDVLRHEGLIGGTLESDASEPIQLFAVPLSARPLAHDSSVINASAYNDKRLFFDAGYLLGRAHVLTPKAAIRGDIGRALVVVEFTRPGERNLVLTPGVEWLLDHHEASTEEIAQYYSEEFEKSFKRFDDVQDRFAAGWTSALIEGREG